jgi:4-methyl-5(b-hydroxyethyl)-thiazole monophosphate biosynthesis
MKKALVILAKGVEEIEAVTVIDVLRRAGIEVTVAGLTSLRVKASRGVIIEAEKILPEAGNAFDAFILPGGGEGAKNLASSQELTSLIKAMYEENKLIAAICASPALVLSAADILENKSATCYPGMESHFGKSTRYKEENVVIDGNVITSRGPATALAFALAIVEKLSGKEMSEKIRKETLAP